MRPPRAATRFAASVRKMRDAAPRQAGSLGGKCWPMSPSPMAPSNASVSACNPTSASECPSRRWVWAIFTPHSHTWSPSAKRCTSKPVPLRGSSSGGRRRQQALGKLDVGCRRQLHVAPAAGDEAHRQARPFRQSGIVGEIGAPGGCGTAVGFEDDIVAKRLRCLRPPQAGAVHGPRDGAVGRFLFQRVADRFGGDGAGRSVECGDELADEGRP